MNMYMTILVNGKKEKRAIDKMLKDPDTGMFVPMPMLKRNEELISTKEGLYITTKLDS